MTSQVTSDPQAVLDQLRQMEAASSPVSADAVETAREWIRVIEKTQAFLEDKTHPIVFIGTVGVGKSSLIGVAAGLLVGPVPTDRTSLKNNSILAIGSGRTTVCEVRIRAGRADEQGQVGLVIEPFSAEDMEKEIEIFAESEWRRRQPEEQRGGEDDTDPTSQEIHRGIRGMTGYAEYQESYSEGNIRKRRKVDPLDEVVPRYDTASALAAHLLERAALPARTATAWWWDISTTENLKALKERFEAVNQGSESTAMLPRRMTVVVPKPLPVEMEDDLDVTLIDTRGMDGSVESRADLQELLRDPRAAIVLCGSFKDAPGEAMRSLLRSMAGDAELREAIPYTLLVLLDQGDAEQVNGAGGDREFGQDIKIDECHAALEGIGVSRMIEKTQIIAFDTLKDAPSRLRDVVLDRLSRLRRAKEDQLHENVRNAQGFLESAADELRPIQHRAVDEKLKAAMALHLPTDAPLRDPLEGLYQAIRETRYASVVYATCRRNGAYSRLDLYAAVRAEASRAATVWLDPLVDAILEKLDELERDPAFGAVQDDIRLRKRLYQDAQIKVIRRYAEQVGAQVESSLKSDRNLWELCRDEWGRGDGFKNRVLGHLENWSRRQQSITAHESTEATRLIPLLSEVSRPAQAPRFMLRIRNLRALRRVVWSPEPLTVLIGANGAGKTTLLQTLRLLRLAYERGLPEAVTIVLGGSGNLRSWGATEVAPSPTDTLKRLKLTGELSRIRKDLAELVDSPVDALKRLKLVSRAKQIRVELGLPDSELPPVEDEPVEIGIDLGEASWRIRLTPREGSVDYLTHECLSEQGREIFSRDSLGAFVHGGERIEPSPQLGLRALMDRGTHESAVRAIAKLFQRIAVYHDFDLWTLRRQGSNKSEDRILHSRGVNALALLRRWRQERANDHRYRFVFEGLVAAFPNAFADMDFVEAGNTLVARVYRPGEESPSPLADEANGVLQLLVLFCAVAAAEDESVIAIDEPENSLHPYALRAFLRRTSRWASQHHLTVLLATHSTVLLDELTGHPESVYVMKAPEPAEPVPTRLDQLCDPGWLENFKLGELYEQGEIGSNEDEA